MVNTSRWIDLNQCIHVSACTGIGESIIAMPQIQISLIFRHFLSKSTYDVVF